MPCHPSAFDRRGRDRGKCQKEPRTASKRHSELGSYECPVSDGPAFGEERRRMENAPLKDGSLRAMELPLQNQDRKIQYPCRRYLEIGTGGSSSIMQAFSSMLVHLPLVPAWLCLRCWRKWSAR